jgi:hypothetical protein
MNSKRVEQKKPDDCSTLKNNMKRCTQGVSTNLKLFKALKNGVFWDVTPCGSCKN